MKTFEQIMEQIKNTSVAIANLEEKKKAIMEEYTNVENVFERKDRYHDFEEKIISVESLLETSKIGNALLQNNARIALFHEVIPVVLEVLKKYNGKPYGEKTSDKICKEVVDRTGCRAYIRSKYSQDTIDIYPPYFGNQYAITAGIVTDPKNGQQQRLLVDNKIQEVPFESFRIWYIKNEYIEDIPQAITEIKALHAQALAIQEQLKEVCSKFNKYAVDGIHSIYHNTNIIKYIV